MKVGLSWLLALAVVTASSWAQTAVVLPDLQKPHQIAVDGNDLYVFEESDYSLHIYTISPFGQRLTFGQKGEGPRDFKYLPFVFVQSDRLACTDFTKTLWFSKKGEFLKGQEYSELKGFDLNSEMLLIPFGDRYVRITADHAQEKRHVDLLGPGFETVKELYEGPFVWNTGAPINYRTDTVCSGNRIFVSDTRKGFFISVFDDQGNLLRTIDKSREVEEVPGFPLLHQYTVSDDRIYATTYKKMDGKTEMLVLDPNGRILKRLYLALASIGAKRGVLRYDLFCVGKNKLYELVQNPGTKSWELLVTDLGRRP